MKRQHLAVLLTIALTATTAGAGEEWGMRPRESHPAPAPTAPVGGDDLAPELGRQLAILKVQP
ncbi:MAG: hypothetical protein WCF02_09255, partial [Azonexus sp.]